MSTRFCPHCGAPALSSASFCASCGSALGSGGPPVAPGQYPPGAAGAAPAAYRPSIGGTDRLVPSSRADDEAALRYVQTAAAIGIISSILGFIALGWSQTDRLTSVAAGGSGLTVSLSALYALSGFVVVGIALGLLYLLYFHRGFQVLAVEDSDFRTPSTLTLMLLIAVVILALLLLALFAELVQAASCAGAGNPITSACLNVGGLLGIVLLLALVAVVALVGLIGMMVGIWRLGNRYQSGLFKAGAILLIIPYVSVLGMIFILAAASTARKQLSGGSFRYAFGGA